MLLWHTRALSQDDIKNRLAGNHLGTVTITQQLCRCRIYKIVNLNFEMNLPTILLGTERSCEHLSHTVLQGRDSHKLTFMFRHEYFCGGPLCAVICMRQFQQELHHPSIPLLSAALDYRAIEDVVATDGHCCHYSSLYI